MANVDLGSAGAGFIDKRRGANFSSATQALHGGSSLGTPGNYDNINVMRTRLAVINAAYYTAARLDTMSENDMIYALRSADDAASI